MPPAELCAELKSGLKSAMSAWFAQRHIKCCKIPLYMRIHAHIRPPEYAHTFLHVRISIFRIGWHESRAPHTRIERDFCAQNKLRE